MSRSIAQQAKLVTMLASVTCAGLVAHTTFAFSDAAAPSAATLIQALKSKGPARGIHNNQDSELIKSLKAKSSRGLAITSEEREQLAKVTEKLPAYDMDIFFDINSAEISNRAKPAVEALGKALQDSQLKGANFVVAGHTDATGGASFNQSLSEQRAKAVREYLVSHYSLGSDQLLAVGYGPQQLKNPKQPYSGENRRVQIVNLGE